MTRLVIEKSKMTVPALTFDQTFLTLVAASATVLVLSALWIVRVLIQIEKSKVVALSSVLEDDGTGDNDLAFEESTSDEKKLEVEPADGSPSEIEMSPTGASKKKDKASSKSEASPDGKPQLARRVRRKNKRVSWAFINIQIVSVLVLTLLTYLLLVQSNAGIFWRMLGSFAVFAVFLRFQIGEEIRRQRVDRLMLLLSLFLLIASMLSALVFSFKMLSQGEIYEGPARIVGYSLEQYNNTKHDPTTRTDIAVSWGKDWGCPWTGGKVCQANVEGAMCQTHPDKEQTKHKPHYSTRQRKRLLDEKEKEAEQVEEALEEDLEDEEQTNEELEDENKDLEKENEMLEEEIEELKEENELEDEENEELVDQENSALNYEADEYNEDIMIVEEDEYEDAQAYVDAEYTQAEDELEDEIDSASDEEEKEELEEELEEDEADQEELDEEYEEDENLLEDYASEYANEADEDYEDFVEEQDETYELDEEKDEAEEDAEETEEEAEELEEKIEYKYEDLKDQDNSDNSDTSSAADDVYEEMEEEVEEEEEKEIEEEYEEEYYDEDDDEEWWWDENPDYYDDDYYEDEYWDYDWDSVWGEYACEDLFDTDIGGQTYDPYTPAGGDDEWPFVYIYGSCKTCEAYILDYFAEEAFEKLEDYKQQSIVYLAGALAGFVWSFLSYVKYRVLPESENEIALMGNDGGVMA